MDCGPAESQRATIARRRLAGCVSGLRLRHHTAPPRGHCHSHLSFHRLGPERIPDFASATSTLTFGSSLHQTKKQEQFEETLKFSEFTAHAPYSHSPAHPCSFPLHRESSDFVPISPAMISADLRCLPAVPRARRRRTFFPRPNRRRQYRRRRTSASRNQRRT